eukprot:TRINITY_DN25611_c0_g1_i1.p1 TRINITY_DN25611_c0_g1~~TRINITY_DN25611_c0_g1_i1.p1  ORF type:complete len:347 (-),score=89.02 TRINITY_DN25611_c0_g1_i1:149-1189(-)
MGCGGSKSEADKNNAMIEKQMMDDKSKMDKIVKLLLLGTGESGKSTLAKQIKINYLHGYTDEERAEFRSAIINNVVFCMKSIITGAQSLEIKIKAKESAEEIQKPEYELLNDTFPPGIVDHIKKLWADKGIQKAFARQSEFQLYDSAAYFFENIDRIAAKGYVPTVDDVLRARVKTTGISEINYTVDETKFKLVDVGGQRSERKKWLHCFDDVTAILFVVAISEYDLKCFEDGTTNRMQESLRIFSETINNPSFINTPIILFLNKSDLFAEKIKKTPLTVCFPEYTESGNDPHESALNYVKEQFLKQSKNCQKPIYSHVTCATNTDLVRRVFESVKNVIISQLVKN